MQYANEHKEKKSVFYKIHRPGRKVTSTHMFFWFDASFSFSFRSQIACFRRTGKMCWRYQGNSAVFPPSLITLAVTPTALESCMHREVASSLGMLLLVSFTTQHRQSRRSYSTRGAPCNKHKRTATVPRPSPETKEHLPPPTHTLCTYWLCF